MTLTDFVKHTKEDLNNFQANLSELPERSEFSRAKWMQWFLDWLEWKTEMHEEYWGEEK